MLAIHDEVLRRVEGRIEKDTWYRKSLPPSLKLSITLRHLACGDNYPSLSYNFRVAPNTISVRQLFTDPHRPLFPPSPRYAPALENKKQNKSNARKANSKK
jgi:hypothetical protein